MWWKQQNWVDCWLLPGHDAPGQGTAVPSCLGAYDTAKGLLPNRRKPTSCLLPHCQAVTAGSGMPCPCGTARDSVVSWRQCRGLSCSVEMREQEGVYACSRGAFPKAPRGAGRALYDKIKEFLHIGMGGSASETKLRNANI